jgi:hypothetical protein
MPLNVDKISTGSLSVNGTDITGNAPYKVYTALLTQSGGDNPAFVPEGAVTKGVTYQILDNSDGDFSNIGAPNNNVGTYFVAANNGIPNSYGNAILGWNEGAPVATVLENTIGNIWFTYDIVGGYLVNSNNLFTNNKSSVIVGNVTWEGGSGIIRSGFDGDSYIIITTNSVDGTLENNDSLLNTLIEIRVYN